MTSTRGHFRYRLKGFHSAQLSCFRCCGPSLHLTNRYNDAPRELLLPLFGALAQYAGGGRDLTVEEYGRLKAIEAGQNG